MAYDFDWDGSTLSLSDEEAQTFVLPDEPTGNQVGAGSSGMLSGHTDFVNFGLYNANFRLGPPDPTQNLDVQTSTSGSNFMPHWRFIQSSNTNITAKQVRDASSPSGSNVRFTFASGSADDAAYLEQVVDIGGDRLRQYGDYIRAAAFMPTGTGGQLGIGVQYMTVDGSLAGMPAERASTVILSSGTTAQIIGTPDSAASIPLNASKVRLRLYASRASGTGAVTIDVANVRRDRGVPYQVVPDQSDPDTYPPGVITQANGILKARSNNDTATLGMLGAHLVPLEFVYDNIPAGATTELLPSSTNMTLGGVPRVVMPWGGSIVGMSYRISAAPTAGTINFQATVGGSNVWSPFGALGTGMATGDELSQAIGTDTFTTGQGVGVQVVTSGGYLPTTRHVHVVLWLAVNYLGA